MSKTVLSINASRPMTYMLQTVLSRKYTLFAAADVFQGMQQLKKNDSIDLVLVDVDFSTEESWEFIRHIKSSWIYNRPTVVLTTDRSLPASEKGISSGVDFFFQKPFSPIDLIKTIDTLLHAPSVINV